MFPFIDSLSSSRLWMQCNQLLQASVALTSPQFHRETNPFFLGQQKRKEKKKGREKKKKGKPSTKFLFSNKAKRT